VKRHRLSIFTAALAAIAGGTAIIVALLLRPQPVRADSAVGDAACLSCHREKAGFEQTAHHLTSQGPTREAIDGDFRPAANVLLTANPALHFRMDSTASGFYQTAVAGSGNDTTIHTERIDIVTGVRKGQSYLHWRGDSLYQLPVSYWNGIGWINSPGYRDGVANFDRPIMPRCLECHATAFKSAASTDPSASNRYRTNNVALGISCESCHGGGRVHVVRERTPLRRISTGLLPSGIINPARFTRGQRLDACALCHAGLGTLKTPAFSYTPGRPLSNHLAISLPTLSEPVDVHGNQLELLARSTCFLRSQMTCSTCHDVHETQRDPTVLSGRCLSCHTVQSCGLYAERHETLVGKCVSCHMPLLPSSTIIANRNGAKERPMVRTHWIQTYPDVSAP
jgi:hypothetical protein